MQMQVPVKFSGHSGKLLVCARSEMIAIIKIEIILLQSITVLIRRRTKCLNEEKRYLKVNGLYVLLLLQLIKA